MCVFSQLMCQCEEHRAEDECVIMSRRPDACMRMDGTALWKPDTRLQRFHYVVHVSRSTTTQEPTASAPPINLSLLAPVFTHRDIRLSALYLNFKLWPNTSFAPAYTLWLYRAIQQLQPLWKQSNRPRPFLLCFWSR